MPTGELKCQYVLSYRVSVPRACGLAFLLAGAEAEAEADADSDVRPGKFQPAEPYGN